MRKTARPQLQQLESRCLLANNVLASVVNGNLIVVGDAADNVVNVVQMAPGTIALVNTPQDNIEPTTINGVIADENVVPPPNAPYVFSGVTGDVYISLGDGNDQLGIAIDVGDDLTINTGAGDDFIGTLVFLPSWAPQRVNNLVVQGDATINMGDGADFLFMDSDIINDDLTINMGSGDDFAILFGDYRDDVTINLGAGADSLSMSASAPIGDDLTINAGSGDDSVALNDLVVAGSLTLGGGSGFDTLQLVSVTACPTVTFGFEQIL